VPVDGPLPVRVAVPVIVPVPLPVLDAVLVPVPTPVPVNEEVGLEEDVGKLVIVVVLVRLGVCPPVGVKDGVVLCVPVAVSVAVVVSVFV